MDLWWHHLGENTTTPWWHHLICWSTFTKLTKLCSNWILPLHHKNNHKKSLILHNQHTLDSFNDSSCFITCSINSLWCNRSLTEWMTSYKLQIKPNYENNISTHTILRSVKFTVRYLKMFDNFFQIRFQGISGVFSLSEENWQLLKPS